MFNTIEKDCPQKNKPAYKILIIGEAGVGKTSLKIRYTDNEFNESPENTIGIDFQVKSVQITPNESVLLSIWDTAGSEKYRSIAHSYFTNCHAILLCFSLIDRESFDALSHYWLDLIEQYVKKKDSAKDKQPVIVLVGTKLDEKTLREITYEEGENYAQMNDMEYYEVSSKTGAGVVDVFFDIAKILYQRGPPKDDSYRFDNLKDNASFMLGNDYYSKYHQDKEDDISGSRCAC